MYVVLMGLARDMSKSKLNIYCQKSHISTAMYETGKQDGFFVSKVTIDGKAYASEDHYDTKKEAEHDAANVALQSIVDHHPMATSVDDLLERLDGKQWKRAAALGSIAQRFGRLQVVASPTVNKEAPGGLPSPTHQENPATAASAQAIPVSVPLTRLSTSPRGVPARVVPAPHRDAPVVPLPHGGAVPLLHGGAVPPPRGGAVPPPPGGVVPPPRGGAVPPPRGTVPSSYGGVLPSSHGDPVPNGTQPADEPVASQSGDIIEFDFIEELERYCCARSLPPPTYSINEQLVGSVVVNGVQYGSCGKQSSFLYARKNAAMVALASLGVQALRLQEPGMVLASSHMRDLG